MGVEGESPQEGGGEMGGPAGRALGQSSEDPARERRPGLRVGVQAVQAGAVGVQEGSGDAHEAI